MHRYNVYEILHQPRPHPSPGAYLSSRWLLRASHIFPLCDCPSPPASWLVGSFIFIFSIVHLSIQRALRKCLPYSLFIVTSPGQGHYMARKGLGCFRSDLRHVLPTHTLQHSPAPLWAPVSLPHTLAVATPASSIAASQGAQLPASQHPSILASQHPSIPWSSAPSWMLCFRLFGRHTRQDHLCPIQRHSKIA